MQFVDPTLVIALAGCQRVDFGGHAHHLGNVASLGLSTAHAAKSCSDEERDAFFAFFAHHLACGVEHRDGGAVHDALRTYIHIGAGSHLAILRHAQGVAALPVVGFGVVGNDHTVSHYHTGRILVRGEESQRMSAVHYQRLLVCHLAQVLHHKAILCPVLEHGTIAAVGDEFVRMLCHRFVQIVLDHHHDGGSLTALVGILVNGSCLHLIAGTEAVHINAAIVFEFLRKLGQQGLVELGGEVAQCIAQREFLLFGCEDVLAFRRMVDVGLVGHGFGQNIGNTSPDVGNEFFFCHGYVVFRVCFLRFG